MKSTHISVRDFSVFVKCLIVCMLWPMNKNRAAIEHRAHGPIIEHWIFGFVCVCSNVCVWCATCRIHISVISWTLLSMNTCFFHDNVILDLFEWINMEICATKFKVWLDDCNCISIYSNTKISPTFFLSISLRQNNGHKLYIINMLPYVCPFQICRLVIFRMQAIGHH